VTLADLEKHALSLGDVVDLKSGRQEYLENIVNSIMFE
jgi:xylose isomerase